MDFNENDNESECTERETKAHQNACVLEIHSSKGKVLGYIHIIAP